MAEKIVTDSRLIVVISDFYGNYRSLESLGGEGGMARIPRDKTPKEFLDDVVASLDGLK